MEKNRFGLMRTKINKEKEQGIVGYARNHSTWEVEVGESGIQVIVGHVGSSRPAGVM